MQNLSRTKLLSEKFAVPAFFGLLFLLGLLIYKDYGISWDEPVSQQNGVISAIYVAKKLNPDLIRSASTLTYFKDLNEHADRDYGVFFDLLSFGIERLFKITDLRELYLMRHFLNFLFFYTCVFFFYKLIRDRFKSWTWGLLAAFFLVLSPRIFADAFYNSKDLVFLSVFGVSCYTMIRFLEKPGYKRAFWHALACAVAIDTRIAAVCVPALTAGVYFFNFFGSETYRINKHKTGLAGLLLLGMMGAFTVFFWPFLWDAPLQNFALAFKNMSRFRWGCPILYNGEMISAAEIPWHYFPVWLFITTPFYYTFLFLAGLVALTWELFRNPFRNLFRPGALQSDLVFATLFFGPAASIIILDSVLYDGWRQLYFLYIPFLYLATLGLAGLWESVKTRKALKTGLLALTGLHLAHVLFFMVRYHPHQFAYFSFLRGEAIEQNFERDYWGLSARKGIEYLLRQHPEGIIRVAADMHTVVVYNKLLLSEADRSRLVVDTCATNAAYFFATYRLHPQRYKFGTEVFRVKVQDATILSVLKLDEAYPEQDKK